MKLYEQITKKGLTSKSFAEAIGSDAPMVSKFTHYKCLPIPPTLKIMCDVLGCNAEDIYSSEEMYYAPTKKQGQNKKANNYKLTVCLPKEAKAFFKKALKKCGYRDITDWILHCYARLQKRYEIILTAEREKALRDSEKPKDC